MLPSGPRCGGWPRASTTPPFLLKARLCRPGDRARLIWRYLPPFFAVQQGVRRWEGVVHLRDVSLAAEQRWVPMAEMTENQFQFVLDAREWGNFVEALDLAPEASSEFRELLSKIPPWSEGATILNRVS